MIPALYRTNAKQVLRLDRHFCDAIDSNAADSIAEAMNNYGPQLRYELVKEPSGYRYGDWHIRPADWIRPHPSFDWDWVHDDYDGAEDSNDHRYGSAADAFNCILAIHEWEDDQ